MVPSFLQILLSLMLLTDSTSFSTFQTTTTTTTTTATKRRYTTTTTTTTQIHLFNNLSGSNSGGGGGTTAKIPSSTNDRDNQAISAIKAAIAQPRMAQNPLLECEFPALAALNKLGDGSLRSTLEAEDANLAFVQKLVNGLASASSSPIPPFFGSLGLGLGPRPTKVILTISSSASNSFWNKARKLRGGATFVSLKEGRLPSFEGSSLSSSSSSSSSSSKEEEEVWIFVTPSSPKDFQAAKSLAASGTVKAVVIVNAFAKDQKSIGDTATMAYFLKPLTYNSQIAGFLVRSYPSLWTVLDAETKHVLGSFSDDEILVKKTNTPDLRPSGRLVQRSVDERAIRARANNMT